MEPELDMRDAANWPTVTTGLPEGVDDDQVKDWLEDPVRTAVEQGHSLEWHTITSDFENSFRVDLGDSMTTDTIRAPAQTRPSSPPGTAGMSIEPDPRVGTRVRVFYKGDDWRRNHVHGWQGRIVRINKRGTLAISHAGATRDEVFYTDTRRSKDGSAYFTLRDEEIKHQEVAADPYYSGDDAWCGHEASCPNGPDPHRQRLSCWDVARARSVTGLVTS